ncbi:MAG: hypothetical protein CHKLHMKO_00468 [Candidatus Argoarchaeum ethanivorans]|uniref:Uncharacterized protein n=1 Tax=Candidatus Argoarchaeum ethanivorans TaxID=2608793 RepID=A0A811T7W5_9EURY|nr:MAG: hypothetical protein CHKLHMKO_00468 [Candidatus Argoarchaeum ethanivorans]
MKKENLYKQKKIFENTINELNRLKNNTSGSVIIKIATHLPRKVKNCVVIEPKLKDLQKSLGTDGKDAGVTQRIEETKQLLKTAVEKKDTFEDFVIAIQVIITHLQKEIETLQDDLKESEEKIDKLRKKFIGIVKPKDLRKWLRTSYKFSKYTELDKALEYRINTGETFAIQSMHEHVWGDTGQAKYQKTLETLATSCIADDRLFNDVWIAKGDNNKSKDYLIDIVYMVSSSSNIRNGIEQELKLHLKKHEKRIGKEWISIQTKDQLNDLCSKITLMRLVIGWDYSKQLESLYKEYNKNPSLKYITHTYPVADKEDPYVRPSPKTQPTSRSNSGGNTIKV